MEKILCGAINRRSNLVIAMSSLIISMGFAACGPEAFLPVGGMDGGGTGGVAASGMGGVAASGTGGVLTGGGTGGGAGGDSSTADGGVTIHYDFESTLNLDNWQAVGNEVPTDVQDQVLTTTAQHHHGIGSLALIYDGAFTPPPTGTNPYYGVYTAFNPPPPGAIVNMWVFSTAAGVSIQVYAQTMPSYLWQGLIVSNVLVQDTWTEITVTMPTAAAFYLGCLINSPLDISGTIYLDDISW
jgi:hypothetical protein